MSMPQAVLEGPEIPGVPVREGKVRRIYDLGDMLLLFATDRISAFDCVMPNGIPGKGMILTGLSDFWFDKFGDRFENHLLPKNEEMPPEFRQFVQQLWGRSMLVRKTKVVPIECVARGYLAGSGWKEYQKTGTVCGIRLPAGLKQCGRLPEPIFTPATKEESGHDQNINFEEMVARVGAPIAESLRQKTLELYSAAAGFAAPKGVIIADTKFEFGQLPDGRIILIDEVLTPDSSRFWLEAQYVPGHDQPSMDKQFVRNWAEDSGWNKKPPAPELPSDVVEGTRARYIQAYRLLTGREPLLR